MLEFQPRSLWRRFIHSRIFLILLLIIIIFLALSVWRLYVKSRTANEAFKLVASEKAKLEEREKFLSASIAELETERGIERVIREKFGMLRPGEKVINLVEPAEATGTPIIREHGVFYRLWQSIVN